MTTKGPFLAVLTVTTALAGAAAAQQPPPAYEQPPPNQPPPDYQQQPPPGYAPPPGYQQPGYQQPPPGYAPPPSYAPAPPPQVSEEAGRFGSRVQLVISDDLLISAYDTTRTTPSSALGPETSDSTTTVTFRPALDLFVARNFSIGGQVIIGVSSYDGGSSAAFGVLPRVGFNIPLGPKVSIWPRLSAGYVFTSYSTTGITESTSGYTFQVQAFVPVLFHPVPHFFIGVGPLLYSELISKTEDADDVRYSSFGVQSTIGGYLGGR